MGDRSARAALLLTALLFSTGGTAIKAISLSSWQVAAGRSVIAALVLLAGTRAWRAFSWRAGLVGAAQAGTFITYVAANKLTTAANAVFLQATAPLYIALLAPLLLGERFKRRDIPLLILIFAGLLLLFAGAQAPTATAPHRVLGSLVGIVSGFCWALTIMGLRWLARSKGTDGVSSAAAATTTGNVLAFLVCLPAAVPFPAMRATDVAGVLYLGVFQVGAAYLLLTRAMRHVPAATASLLMLVEPALSPFLAWAVHGEAPGSWPLVGGVIIIAAATTATWRDSREVREA